MPEPSPAGAPLTLWRGTVLSAWVDYNGHLSDAYYMVAFSMSTDALMDHIGLDAAGRARTGHSIFTLEAHVNYLLEVKQDAPIEVRTQLLGADAKRLQVFHQMFRQGSDAPLAVSEQMLLCVDMAQRRSAPFPPEVAAQVAALARAHAQLAAPPYSGRRIALPG